MRHECLVRPEDLGPYLLGQLDAETQDSIAALVAACPSCTEEVRLLRPVVASLDAATATLASPSHRLDIGGVRQPAGIDGLLTVVRRERARRRSRTWRVAAAAAVVAVVLTLGAVALLGSRSADGQQVTLAVQGQGQARGSAVVAERAWGTAIVLTVRGLAPGKPYGAWLQDRSGRRVPAGTFTPTSKGTVRLDLSALISLDDSAAMGVTQLGGADVLRHDF